MCLIGAPEDKTRKNGKKDNIWRENSESFPELEKDMNPYIKKHISSSGENK